MSNRLIFTVYGKDGTKTRTPIGFTGKQCNVATKPYEEREIQSQVKKTVTGDACLPEETIKIEEQVHA